MYSRMPNTDGAADREATARQFDAEMLPGFRGLSDGHDAQNHRLYLLTSWEPLQLARTMRM